VAKTTSVLQTLIADFPTPIMERLWRGQWCGRVLGGRGDAWVGDAKAI